MPFLSRCCLVAVSSMAAKIHEYPPQCRVDRGTSMLAALAYIWLVSRLV